MVTLEEIVTKKNIKKNKLTENDLTRSYSLIKDDLIKLKKDLGEACRLARQQAKKQVENKLSQTR
jgi:hypothetical protein